VLSGNGRENMKRKVTVLILCAMLLALCFSAEAQQPGKIPRIGYISGTGSASDPGPYVEALRQGLRDLGYVEGKSFVIEYRGAEGKLDRIPSLVNELVQLKVDVLVVPIPSAIRAAKQATKTIPVVMVTGLDPVETGLVDSLARPGGNITGLATLAQDLSGKRLELLKEVVPRLSRVGVLRNPDDSTAAIALKEYEAAARVLKIQLQSIDVQGSNPDLEGAFQTAAKGRAGALITVTTAPLFLQRKRVAELAIKNRLPSLYQGSAWVEAGGLMSYSTDDLAMYRRAATYVDKILKGTKPADLPIEQPTKFEFVINLKTAKALNLAIPQSVLFRADRVIK
jgi:putative tryptophan/tyrosine transport system substrate-binding protein